MIMGDPCRGDRALPFGMSLRNHEKSELTVSYVVTDTAQVLFQVRPDLSMQQGKFLTWGEKIEIDPLPALSGARSYQSEV